MQLLAVAAITALQEADMAAEAQLIHTRVLSQPPEQLLEPTRQGPQISWTFKPFVELLMLELRAIATAPRLSLAERRERTRWTLDVAGF